METALTPAAILQQRWGTAWLVSAGAESFWAELECWQQQFQADQPRDVLLAELDAGRFLAAFFAAAQCPCRVWLTNPQWGTREWSQVAAQCQPDVIVGNLADEVRRELSLPREAEEATCWQREAKSRILIPTGGSSGNIRFAVHTWDTLSAAVWGFCQHFDRPIVNAYCVLPLYHVSGLMQAMRCLLSGGQLVCQPFRDLRQRGPLTPAGPKDSGIGSVDSFLSLVPTQLQRLLSGPWDAVPWLQQFVAILLGGAPAWPSLLQTAHQLRLPLAPTYGMTETASQVATLLPREFWAGQTGSGRALPHARLTIRDGANELVPPNQVGQVVIEATSLALAEGQPAIAPPWPTGDLGYLDESGFLHLLGRESTLIITGGEKVLPEEVEAAILATGLAQDVAVLGIPDVDWGEKVVAVVVMGGPAKAGDNLPSAQLYQALTTQLSTYKLPKQWWRRSALPRNAQGKLNRSALRRWVIDQLAPTAGAIGSVPPSGAAAGD